MIEFLRIWKGSAQWRTCRCKQRIQYVIDDRGRTLPFKADAKSLREDRTPNGIFLVFPKDSFHECPKRKTFGGRSPVAASAVKR